MDTEATQALLAGLPERISAIPRYWMQRQPDAPALHDGGRYWSYAQLSFAIDGAAQMLRELGVRAGDRLMVVGENCMAQVALTFAAAGIDAWIVHVNSRLSSLEVDALRSHSGARRVLYTTGSSLEALAHAHRHNAVPCDCPLLGMLWIGALKHDAPIEAVAQSNRAQVAALIYTSGTTGAAKGVMLSHRNLLFIAAVSSKLRGLATSDRAYGVLPLAHVYGLASVMLGTLYAGACLYLAPRFSPTVLLNSLKTERLTILQGVPAMYARLLATLATENAAALPLNLGAHLRFIYAGGSPLDPGLKRRVEHCFGLPLHNGYGMTESAPTISQTRLDAPRNDTSVGLAIPGVAVRIVDQSGLDAGPNNAGELWVRGPNVMLGYYRAPELTAAALRPGGWLSTGDLARQELDGALFIVGRSKDLIIRSGFKIYPLELETLINAYPGVLQSAVVGRLVADGDEEVVAFIEIDPLHTVQPAHLQSHLARLLAPYKCPAEVIVMAALPASSTGKILKARLRELAQASGQFDGA